MDDELRRWKAYFYPPPNDATLRNLPGIKDPGQLRRIDYNWSARRQAELEANPLLVPRTFDAEHVKGIHRHLFQDVYDWAGAYRLVDMAKGSSVFASTDGGIDAYLQDVAGRVAQIDWQEVDRVGFAVRAATVFGMLNKAHPFREGNGRTAKVFMRHVAGLSRFDLCFDRVEPASWNQASAACMGAPGQFLTDPEPLVPVVLQATVPRKSQTQQGQVSVHRPFSLMMPASRSLQPLSGPGPRPPYGRPGGAPGRDQGPGR